MGIELSLQLSPTSGTPLYRQLVEQIQRMVASGQLQSGDKVPSVRQLATHFDVNPMTISKAYSLLEMDGVLVRLRGRGMEVAPQAKEQQSLEQRLALIAPTLQRLVAESRQLGISAEELSQALKRLLEEQA